MSEGVALLHENNVYLKNREILSYSWPSFLYALYSLFLFKNLKISILLYKFFLILYIYFRSLNLEAHKKILLYTSLTIPIAWQQITSWSLDALIYITIIEYYYFNTKKYYFYPLISMIKPYFFPIIFYNRGEKINILFKNKELMITLIISFILIIWVFFLNRAFYKSPFQTDIFFLELSKLSEFFLNIFKYSHSWIRQIYGFLGANLSIMFPIYIYVLALSLLLKILVNSILVMSLQDKLICLLVTCLSFLNYFLICPSGLGFQGRYLTPILIILISRLPEKNYSSCAALILINLYCLGFQMVTILS